MIQNGNLIRLNLDGTLVAKMTSLDFSVEREMLDATDKYSNDFRVVQPGNKSWTASCEGFVADPYDKNALNFSENFSNSYWTKTGLTLSSTLVNDPNGFKRAFRTSGASLGDSISAASITSVIASSYTFSVWVKSVTGTVNCSLNIDNGTDTQSQAITATTTWQRFSLTETATAAAQWTVKIDLAATGEIEIFGAQLEIGSTATSYEPTGINFKRLYDAVENGTKFNAVFTDATTGNVEYDGDVYVSNFALTAPQGQLVTFSAELTGTGAIAGQTI